MVLSPERPPSTSQQLIFTRVGAVNVGIPSDWVAEIIRVSRSQLLDLPFYSPLFLGVIHHSGAILPLVSGHRLLQLPETGLRETSIVVSLNATVANLAHVGLVVDQLLGGTANTPSAMTSWTPTVGTPPLPHTQVLLHPHWLPQDMWQPRQWGTMTPNPSEDAKVSP